MTTQRKTFQEISPKEFTMILLLSPRAPWQMDGSDPKCHQLCLPHSSSESQRASRLLTAKQTAVAIVQQLLIF